MEQIALTRPMLIEALATWEIEARCGRCVTREEDVQRSVADVAEDSGSYLWMLLAHHQLDGTGEPTPPVSAQSERAQ